MGHATVKRWSQSEKKKIDVNITKVIQMYNENMGGVDALNKNVNKHQIGIKGKTWRESLFTWLLDVFVHNAWQLARLNNDGDTLHKFTRNIVLSYLTQFGVPPIGAGRKPSTSFSDEKLYDRLDHFVETVPNQKKRRCANHSCKSIIWFHASVTITNSNILV